MAVQKADKPAQAEASTTVDVQLNAYSRYFFHGVVYEKDVKYTMGEEMAKVVLAHHEDGVPIFGRYRLSVAQKQKIQEATAGPRTVDLTKPEVLAAAKSDSPKKKGIEIGTADEERELFGAVDGEQQQL